MNLTHSTAPLVATVPVAALLLAAVTFPWLGPATVQTQPQPEPGVSALATAADALADSTSAATRGGGVARDTHGYAYLGKQQAILEHLDRPPRFRPAPARDSADRAPSVGGVLRDTHGYAYLGKQQAILEHLNGTRRFTG